jgi:hypothetical protein
VAAEPASAAAALAADLLVPLALLLVPLALLLA